jgi:mannose-1-phosphate guanylyltransferase
VVTGLFKGWEKALHTPMEEEFILRTYTECPNLSITYAVMENTDRAWMYPAKFDWQDIGSWESLYNFIPDKDANGNVIGTERHIVESCRDILVITPDRKKKMVAVKGLEDFMVIDTDDVLVICPKDDRKFKEFISGIAMPEFEKYR